MSLPTTMKTVLQPSKTSAALTLTTTPLPIPSHPEDHLVKVHATCPCNGELWWQRDFPSLFPEAKEPVPCSDLAGTVVSAPNASPFRPGDRVFARVDARRPGCAREYTLARTSELAPAPRSLDWIRTAAVPLSALTAWQGLFVHGPLRADAFSASGEEDRQAAREHNAGLRVLVTGAGGGVGSWAVRFAAAAGAGAVVGVCSAARAPDVLAAGATETVDYADAGLGAWAAADPAARECDLVLDCVGGEALLAQAWAALKDGGVILGIVAAPDGARPADCRKTAGHSAWFLVEPLGSQLGEISRLIDECGFEPFVDSVWELEDAEKAFGIVEGGHARGKVVIKVAD